MSNLSQSLRDAVKKLAYGATLDQLKKRGIKQVNVLGIDRIVSLIEEAVNRSLRHRLMGIERVEVADATKAEFLRMLKSNEELEKTKDEFARQQQRAQEEMDELRGELTKQKRMLADKLGIAQASEASRYEGENAEIAKQIETLFTAFVERGETNLAPLRDEVTQLTFALLDQERHAAMQARAAARDREVELLERRISKMTKALEENEGRLAQLARMKNVDDGIASIYDEVQGLQAGAANYEKKRELMSEIFKANLALQKGVLETRGIPS